MNKQLRKEFRRERASPEFPSDNRSRFRPISQSVQGGNLHEDAVATRE
jgi:hypothetical protein